MAQSTTIIHITTPKKQSWWGKKPQEQWPALAAILCEHNPRHVLLAQKTPHTDCSLPMLPITDVCHHTPLPAPWHLITLAFTTNVPAMCKQLERTLATIPKNHKVLLTTDAPPHIARKGSSLTHYPTLYRFILSSPKIVLYYHGSPYEVAVDLLRRSPQMLRVAVPAYTTAFLQTEFGDAVTITPWYRTAHHWKAGQQFGLQS